ncbi:glycosyl transferase family 90 [Polaribacter sp. Asnod1-A03]|uniref:glycosyl transferase family 90 n=1 Tax=Polaribacter sp. Asnod1-A03 TaxID=3160581 RepID=UPI0038634B97
MKSFISKIKRVKLFYYISNAFLDLLPKFLFRNNLQYWLNIQNKYPKEIIENRLNYYFNNDFKDLKIPLDTIKIEDIKLKNNKSFYYYDLIKIARYFDKKLKINYKFGDIDVNQEVPTIVKSRPINHNGNSILLKLNSFRHFNFIEDDLPFSEKKNEIIWRGMVHKQNRVSLVEKFYKKPNFNVGSLTLGNSKPEWVKPFVNIKEQLKYKFILSIEGHDVATNLKWIMSSNSLCFMPKPKFETWYMEGKLIPNFHYVLIKDDYSDVEEKMNFYAKNTSEAEQIIKNAKSWTLQFKDKKLEKLLSILIINSYFQKTKQLK